MKSRRWFILLALVGAALAVCAGKIISGRPTFSTDAPMAGFSFSHSGMHSGLIYTLSASPGDAGWQADISLLGGEEAYVLDMSGEDVKRLAALAEEHNLQCWAGFDRTDPRCLDGTGFCLRIDYADGTHIYAEGSNAFPKNYNAAHDAILSYYIELMEKNGIGNPM